MRKGLILLSCALLAAPIIIGGAFPNVSAQERANQQQVEKQKLAKEKKQKREHRGRKDKADKNGSYRRGPLEVALPTCCDGDCEGAQTLSIFIAGDQDGFNPGDAADQTSPSPALQAYMDQYNNGAFPNRQFDDQASNRVFGHTFTGLPVDITCATLEIGLKAGGDIQSNDGIDLDYDGTESFAWHSRISNLPEAGGTWTNGQTAVIRFDLAGLPPGGTNIISSINADNSLDVYVQDDTAVDYIILSVVTYDGVWTSWLDRDNSSGKGDYETVRDFIKEGVLPKDLEPVCIQCRTLGGVDWQDAGQNYHCELPLGGYCVNAENDDENGEQCLDYEVRFFYPN